MTGPVMLCDLDGTLYEAGETVPGAVAAVAELRSLGITLRFFTNTDSRPPSDVVADLRERGFEVADDEVFTPVVAALLLLGGLPEARVLPVVSHRLRPSFAPFEAGDGPVTHVVVGDARDALDYAALDAAFWALRAGAELVALQRGRYFKAADGDHLDAGAAVAALEYSAGTTARLLGKPSQDFIELAAASAGVGPAEVWVVGDDATTDIAMGEEAGATTVQVETGKFRDQQAEGVASRAAHRVPSIVEVPALLRGVIGGR